MDAPRRPGDNPPMADPLRIALGKMLDEYDERRRGDLAREQQVRDEDAAFLAQFAELRRNVVRPVFEAAGAMLAERGHEFSISEDEFAVGEGGKVTEAGISLHIVPSGMSSRLHADDHGRSLSFSTRHYNKTVWINSGVAMNAGGVAGSKGAFPLARIDRPRVEEELLKFVAGVIAG